jgi:hypothetical protein
MKYAGSGLGYYNRATDDFLCRATGGQASRVKAPRSSPHQVWTVNRKLDSFIKGLVLNWTKIT